MGHLLKLNYAHSPFNPRILFSTSVPFTLTTVQVPNLALTHKKRITVYLLCRAKEELERGKGVSVAVSADGGRDPNKTTDTMKDLALLCSFYSADSIFNIFPKGQFSICSPLWAGMSPGGGGGGLQNTYLSVCLVIVYLINKNAI
jgi:hypothetical protein